MEKYALVTGSADRIGKAIALRLAEKGYNLILHYNSSTGKAAGVKTEVEKRGMQAKLLQLNFTDNIDFDTLFADFKMEGIELEVLINSASDFRTSHFEDKGSALLNKEMKINFESAYLLTKAFASVYAQGQIINLLDTNTEKKQTKHLDYILSKKLLRDFTKLAAVELAPRFRVNGISPGLILPPENEDEKYLMALAKDIPLKTIGNSEQICKAVCFLLDSYFVTGQILYIDGGAHLL